MSGDPNVTLTIRLMMQGKEVGSIIGKKGEIVKKFREDSGARINISDGSSPERIVTITGNTNSIILAFELISKKLEEVYNSPVAIKPDPSLPQPPITLRLIVPASQCGSLIGKGGSKIREIREVTGASIQVASEMLPNSTERAVTISGMSDAITKCIYHICCIMLDSPPKGGTIPYRPRPHGPHGHGMHGGGGGGPMGQLGPPGMGNGSHGPYGSPSPWNPINPAEGLGKLGGSPLAGLAALGLGGMGAGPSSPLNPAASLAALASLAGSQLRTTNPHQGRGASGNNGPPGSTSPGSGSGSSGPGSGTPGTGGSNSIQQEMTVPNELIGCVIGKGGTKIAEIRSLTGAMIRISNSDELREGFTDRIITMTGSPDAVALAQYLINMSVELQKANLEGGTSSLSSPEGSGSTIANTTNNNPGSPDPNGNANAGSTSTNSASTPNLPPLPSIAKLLCANNPILSQLSSLGTLAGGLTELLSAAAALSAAGAGTNPALGLGLVGPGGSMSHGHHGGHHHHHPTTGVHRRGGSGGGSYMPKGMKGSNGGGSPGSKGKGSSSDSRKFNPY